MTRQFVSITIDQFQAALQKGLRAVVDRHKYQNVHLQKDKEATHEHSYKIYVGAGHIYIYINTSIPLGSSVSQGYGEDAIRINLIDGLSGTPVLPKQSHVKRINTWATNLEKRIEELFRVSYNDLEWCGCGSPRREFYPKGKPPFTACCGWSKEHHKQWRKGAS